MKSLITVLIVTCVLFGCKKSLTENEYYTLTGIVFDFDSNTAIANAKVYVKELGSIVSVFDSAVSDANGRVSFKLKNDGRHKTLYPTKAGYLNPVYLYFSYIDEKDRTDTVYLARPSFVNLISHKTGTYLPTDSVDVQVQYDYVEPLGINYLNFRTLYSGIANGPDKTFNLQTIYGHAIGSFFFGTQKVYFKSDIVRNGSVFSTKSDSTTVTQFGTQNFTLNY